MTDIEVSHSDSLYVLKRHAIKSDIVEARLVTGINNVGRDVASIMRHLGVRPIRFQELAVPTDTEIDAVFEEENS